MFSTKRSSLFALLVLGFIVAGCQSKGEDAGASAAPAAQAVTCSKCEITWVKYPITPGGGQSHRVVGYGTRKSMECPDCKSAVDNFFSTGEFKHSCKTCGDALEQCEAH